MTGQLNIEFSFFTAVLLTRNLIISNTYNSWNFAKVSTKTFFIQTKQNIFFQFYHLPHCSNAQSIPKCRKIVFKWFFKVLHILSFCTGALLCSIILLHYAFWKNHKHLHIIQHFLAMSYHISLCLNNTIFFPKWLNIKLAFYHKAYNKFANTWWPPTIALFSFAQFLLRPSQNVFVWCWEH